MADGELILRITGDGGEGVISCGDILARACVRAGLEIFTFKSFPAEARGGYAMHQLRTGRRKIRSMGDGFDVLCTLNAQAFAVDRPLLAAGHVLIHDAAFTPELPAGVHAYAVPMSYIAKEMNFRQAKNMVALGALAGLLALPRKHLEYAIQKAFAALGGAVVANNLSAFAKGLQCAQGLEKRDRLRLPAGRSGKDVVLLSGDEAVGLGALLAGVDFYAAYPITPASDIAHYLARNLPKTGGVLIQAEDEIAAVAQAVGASWAGARAMTATSGPGLSLMAEMLGFAFMAEIPVLVVDVQRGGPSTGLPTKHEQSDLLAAVFGSHGDAPRIVLAAESVADCLQLTVQAVNTAQAYQCPVILLSDASLAFCLQAVPRPEPGRFRRVQRKRWNGKGEYRRYAFTRDGISAVADPGTPAGFHIATGLEHDETGKPSYAPADHEAMSAKRFAKLNKLARRWPKVEIDGEGAADVGVIAWGSSIGPAREAIARLRRGGMHVKGFYPKLLWPLQADQFAAFAASCAKVMVVEVNHQGQLARLIRAETDIRPIMLTKCDGLPFTPGQIAARIEALA